MLKNGIIHVPELFRIGYGVDPDVQNHLIDQLYMSILHKYTQQHRAYHTLQHIEDLGSWYFQWCGSTGQKPSQEMCLAILYHDIVYEVNTVLHLSNEEASSEFFAFHAELANVPAELVEIVMDLILSTAGGDRPHTRLVDLDLLILATKAIQYEHYAKGIRREWQATPDDLYCSERIKFLQGMLKKEYIYKDAEFAKFEPHARTNMQREIDVLTNQGTPVGIW